MGKESGVWCVSDFGAHNEDLDVVKVRALDVDDFSVLFGRPPPVVRCLARMASLVKLFSRVTVFFNGSLGIHFVVSSFHLDPKSSQKHNALLLWR
jgi:hypothetical protein